jgi:hypothetical protein
VQLRTLCSYDSGGNLQEFTRYLIVQIVLDGIIEHLEEQLMYLNTNRLFRDVSAWYHILVVMIVVKATASDRVKFFVNGTQETSFETSNYPAQDVDSELNKATAIRLYSWNGSEYS